MATIRKGDKKVLLVVDVQVGVMQESWDSQRIINNIFTAVENARAHGVPVVWVQHGHDEKDFESPEGQIVPELVPSPGEVRIFKHFNSSFEETSLEETLDRLGVAHIILAGAATNWCIRATAYAALERGYDLTLIKDAHTTAAMDCMDGGEIAAEDIVQELNIIMDWLRYPGRKNASVSVADLSFDTY
jgi:nicotinamidase-related amidase